MLWRYFIPTSKKIITACEHWRDQNRKYGDDCTAFAKSHGAICANASFGEVVAITFKNEEEIPSYFRLKHKNENGFVCYPRMNTKLGKQAKEAMKNLPKQPTYEIIKKAIGGYTSEIRWSAGKNSSGWERVGHEGNKVVFDTLRLFYNHKNLVIALIDQAAAIDEAKSHKGAKIETKIWKKPNGLDEISEFQANQIMSGKAK